MACLAPALGSRIAVRYWFGDLELDSLCVGPGFRFKCLKENGGNARVSALCRVKPAKLN